MSCHNMSVSVLRFPMNITSWKSRITLTDSETLGISCEVWITNERKVDRVEAIGESEREEEEDEGEACDWNEEKSEDGDGDGEEVDGKGNEGREKEGL